MGRVSPDLAGPQEPRQLSLSWGSLRERQGPEGSRESAGLGAGTASASPAPRGQPEFPSNFSRGWVFPETSPFPARESGRGPCASWAWARSAGRAEAMASAGKPPAPPPPSPSALPTSGFHPRAPPSSCGGAATSCEAFQDCWVPWVAVGLGAG